jgi:hypothetical protein
MAKNFNVDPYYDDFDASKNFHRILFKPGYAVQARELTQSQTILQDQITKFADHVFKQNSPVTGGNITTNLNCRYLKLLQSYAGSNINIADFLGKLVRNADGLVVASVIAVAEPTGDIDLDGNYLGDPPTLILSYRSGDHFQDNDIVYDTTSNLAAQAIAVDADGESSVVSIDTGVFYVNGNFVQVNPQTAILSKYSNLPSLRVGLFINENIVDYIDDTALLDPALGASNYQAPGADRYQITLTLTSRPLQLGDDDGFIELVRFNEGQMLKMVDGSVYSVIDDYFAKRTFETNGDYTVTDFKITPKINEDDESKYILNVGKGIAYVKGYRVENPTSVDIVSNKARETETQNNVPVFTDYGSYFHVDDVHGANGYVFDVTTYDIIDLHCVDSANVRITSSNTYNSTLVGSAYVRGLNFEDDNGSSDTSNWTYKMYVTDIQTNALIGFSSGSSSVSNVNIRSDYNNYFSSSNNAYIGCTIKLTEGTNAGESRIVTNYNASTYVFTVDTPWSVAPSSDTKFSLILSTKDTESVLKVNKSSYPAQIRSSANISDNGKTNGIASGDAILENPLTPELIFPVGYPYVSNVNDTSFTTYQQLRGKVFTASAGVLSTQISYSDYSGVIKHIGAFNSTLDGNAVNENFTIIVTDKGINASLNVGDIVSWSSGTRSVTINGDASVATLQTLTSDLSTFTADIIVKVFVSNGDSTNYVLKTKNLVNANNQVVTTSGTEIVGANTFVDDSINSTGQIYINQAGIVGQNQKQSLYLSDVKSVVQIIDTKDPSVVPTIEMLSDFDYDVTNNYSFNNGQKDNFYDHAFIQLRPGAPKPIGNLLVLVNYYKHSGGDGYFTKNSYIDNSSNPEEYRQIPSYTSTYGNSYSLRDCLDFRPARLNAQSDFVFRYSNPGDTVRYGLFLPIDLSIFYCGDYSYYLARKDKLIITRDRVISILEGVSAIDPIYPTPSEGSLVLADIRHNPYTGYIPTEISRGVSDLSIELIQHRRYTMEDISELESRINRIEYYTSLNVLEQSATGIQIQDGFGLNRFKNGILVDDFSSFATADTENSDFVCNINKRTRRLSALQGVNNFALTNLLMAYNMNNPSQSLLNTLSYRVRQDGLVNNYMLPYTETPIITQSLASRTVNINPFAVTTAKGILGLSPNVDNWVDTNYNPSILITAPGLQIFSNTLLEDVPINILSAGDWQAISSTKILESKTSQNLGTQTTTENISAWTRNPAIVRCREAGVPIIGCSIATTTSSSLTTSVYLNTLKEQKNTLYGPYSSIQNTYSLNNGFVTDVSILPFLRKQEIVISLDEMLINAKIYNFFDNVNVDKYVKKPNIVELNNLSGNFKTGDIIGYKPTSTSFVATGKVLGVYRYPNSTSVRLYITGDASVTNHNLGPDGLIHNGTFDANNLYTNGTAHGTYVSYTHNSGAISFISATSTTNVVPARTSNTITLSPLALSSNTSYVSNTIFINAGTGAGQFANVVSYNGASKVATLDKTITYSKNDVYTIGTTVFGDSHFRTNESGSFYASFFIPENTFQNGPRVYRIDNRINNNSATSTTYAEATFFASGLQATKQRLDFGASPSKEVVEYRESSWKTTESEVTSETSRVVTPWDPVAQTFIIDSDNFPNGALLSSAKFFFRSRPEENSPVSLRIVGTTNGYPNGDILPNSYVVKDRSDVKTSETPHFLDSNTYTTFEFPVPVFIQPDVLYAFILRSLSNEYEVWTALNSDSAIPSSVKNLPTDPTPSNITKISATPYIGNLFLSQNAQTWTADQNQSMMFVVERCKFDITKTPSIRFVVPKGLPQRKIINQSIEYFNNANNISTNVSNASNTNILYDALNLTTTDLTPTRTNINYSFSTTLNDGDADAIYSVNPGKYATTMYDHAYLNDGKGERQLFSNNSTSFSLYARLSSSSDAVSPIISESGLTLYTIKNVINNCQLSNNLINLISAGSGYNNASNVTVTVSAPTSPGGTQAFASANVDTANGIIRSVSFTNNGFGSGYVTTPTITITDSSPVPGTGAVVNISGETSSSDGPAQVKYFTKKVVLDQGFDSGDLSVYMTAYRPLNTDILVYYKILNASDTQRFEDGQWQLMTKIKNTDTLYSNSREEVFEYVFAPGEQNSNISQGYVSYESVTGQVYDEFNQFALKIVLTSTDKTFCPYIADLRCIALLKND